MSAQVSNAGFEAAMSILSHVYFAPILGKLIRARVPDLLNGGAVQAAELAKPSRSSSTFHCQGDAGPIGVRRVPRSGAVHVRQ